MSLYHAHIHKLHRAKPHTCMYASMHACMHARMHACIHCTTPHRTTPHPSTHACMHAHTRARDTRKRMHAWMHAMHLTAPHRTAWSVRRVSIRSMLACRHAEVWCMDTDRHMCAHTHPHACRHEYRSAYTCARTHVRVHARTRKSAHACTVAAAKACGGFRGWERRRAAAFVDNLFLNVSEHADGQRRGPASF